MSEQQLERLWESFSGQQPAAQRAAQHAQFSEFVDRLFRLKMDGLLRAVNSTALRCEACGALFSASHITQLRCTADGRCCPITCVILSGAGECAMPLQCSRGYVKRCADTTAAYMCCAVVRPNACIKQTEVGSCVHTSHSCGLSMCLGGASSGLSGAYYTSSTASAVSSTFLRRTFSAAGTKRVVKMAQNTPCATLHNSMQQGKQ
jgi:hypothetical protein